MEYDDDNAMMVFMITRMKTFAQGGSKYGAPWEGVIQELKISKRPNRAASYCQEEANARLPANKRSSQKPRSQTTCVHFDETLSVKK